MLIPGAPGPRGGAPGDAGLIEADRRLTEVGDRRSALCDEFDIDYYIERNILGRLASVRLATASTGKRSADKRTIRAR